MKIAFITLIVLGCLMGDLSVLAYPQSYTIDRFDRNYGDLEDPYPIEDYRNSRFRRTYYSNDGYQRGFYPTYELSNNAPISLSREDDNIDRSLKFTPLLRYRSTRTNRKKLFVPNLWG